MTGLPAKRDVRARWGAPRCGYFASAGVFWVGARVLWLGYLLVWFAAIHFFLFVPRARRGSMRYLDLVHGPRTWVVRCWQTYRHMVEFGFLLMDRTIMLTRAGHGFEIAAEGVSHLRHAAEEQGGVLMLTAHLGNAEIAAPYLRTLGIEKPVHMVMYVDAAEGSEKFHARHRHRLEHVAVISTANPLDAGTRIMAALRKGDLVAMRADRTLAGKGVAVRFLGQQVCLPAGPFLAAVLTGASVLHVYTCRLGYRRYACRISPVHRYPECPEEGGRETALAQAAQEYADMLEKMVREHPYQWSNFYDYWEVQAPVPMEDAS